MLITEKKLKKLNAHFACLLNVLILAITYLVFLTSSSVLLPSPCLIKWRENICEIFLFATFHGNVDLLVCMLKFLFLCPFGLVVFFICLFITCYFFYRVFLFFVFALLVTFIILLENILFF